MYISKKRLEHEINKIKNRRSIADIEKLDLLADLEAITFEEYNNIRNYITENNVAIKEV